ncbi:hypothetical protein LTR03_006521 [Friedmanniomyces endolithicus]|nr:hypothetical protein LTR03_006521 [Friedmanniomyces endolithicus]
MQECWQAVDQTKALLQFYDSLIFQRVRGDVFRSAVLHFPAVLGINEEIGRLRRANDFSYILAGVVYCVRVMAVEIILPSAERDDQDEEDDRRFQQVRAEYLADGSYSVMSKMLRLDERFEISLDVLQDDVTGTKRGVSFFDNAHNGLREKGKWTLQRILSDNDGSKMRRHGLWAMPLVRRYLRKVDRFRELL